MAKTTAQKAAENNEWLEALEGKVREASGRLQELRAENERLAKRVKELERRAEKGADQGTGGGGSGDQWREERAEIRGRVEKLTATLEGLLDGA